VLVKTPRSASRIQGVSICRSICRGGTGDRVRGTECQHCSAATAVIGYDESVKLDVEPARYFVRVVKREKRACKRCRDGAVVMPPVAERIVEKGLASDRVVVETVVVKYCDHLPLYGRRRCWSAKSFAPRILAAAERAPWADRIRDEASRNRLV